MGKQCLVMFCRYNFRITRQVLLFFLALLIFILYYPLREDKSHKTVVFTKKDRFILLWTSSFKYPFTKLERGLKSFQKNKCLHKNCYITDDKGLFSSLTDFHAILFNSRDVFTLKERDLPRSRDVSQKYIFVSLDSSYKYPECNDTYNNYFNWTWTYKMDSEVLWRVFTIHNKSNSAIVAPKLEVPWENTTDQPMNEDVKTKLNNKSRAMAWFVSDCESKSKKQENRIKSLLGQELLHNYNIVVDIFGECGKKMATFESRREMLKRDYFFYMAFEDSLSSDYVGEELLLALDSYTVPIVYGTADYARFLPPDSYLNFVDTGINDIAAIINATLHNRTEYEYFHRWRDMYYHTRSIDSDICNICEVLNNREMYDKSSVYISFSEWWNPSEVVTCT